MVPETWTRLGFPILDFLDRQIGDYLGVIGQRCNDIPVGY
jgi:hypothetical protein